MNDNNFIKIQVTRDPVNSSELHVLANGENTLLLDITPTGRQILNAANCHPTVDFALLQLLPDHSLEEISPEEVAKLNQAETNLYAFHTDRLFYFVLNDNKYPWGAVVPEDILRLLANAPAHAEVWMEHRDEADVLISPGHSVNLASEGVERLYTKIPVWKLDVQGIEVISSEPRITVRHALELAKIDPDSPWTFILKVEGKPKEQVELTTIIDLTTPGIERLRVRPRVINNGEGFCPRRQFSLLDKDEKFLDTAYERWETAIDGGHRWLLLYGHRLPTGYQQSCITLAIEIPQMYPSAEIDMFYCTPAVTLMTGAPISATEFQQPIFGETYQRWSRHRDSNVWSPTNDSVITHLGLIEESFLREVAQ